MRRGALTSGRRAPGTRCTLLESSLPSSSISADLRHVALDQHGLVASAVPTNPSCTPWQRRPRPPRCRCRSAGRPMSSAEAFIASMSVGGSRGLSMPSNSSIAPDTCSSMTAQASATEAVSPVPPEPASESERSEESGVADVEPLGALGPSASPPIPGESRARGQAEEGHGGDGQSGDAAVHCCPLGWSSHGTRRDIGVPLERLPRHPPRPNLPTCPKCNGFVNTPFKPVCDLARLIVRKVY